MIVGFLRTLPYLQIWISIVQVRLTYFYLRVFSDFHLLVDSAYPIKKSNDSVQEWWQTNTWAYQLQHENYFRKGCNWTCFRFRQLNYCKLRGNKKLCNFISCALHNIASEDDLNFQFETSEDPGSRISLGHEIENDKNLRDQICRELARNSNENSMDR